MKLNRFIAIILTGTLLNTPVRPVAGGYLAVPGITEQNQPGLSNLLLPLTGDRSAAAREVFMSISDEIKDDPFSEASQRILRENLRTYEQDKDWVLWIQAKPERLYLLFSAFLYLPDGDPKRVLDFMDPVNIIRVFNTTWHRSWFRDQGISDRYFLACMFVNDPVQTAYVKKIPFIDHCIARSGANFELYRTVSGKIELMHRLADDFKNIILQLLEHGRSEQALRLANNRVGIALANLQAYTKSHPRKVAEFEVEYREARAYSEALKERLRDQPAPTQPVGPLREIRAVAESSL